MERGRKFYLTALTTASDLREFRDCGAADLGDYAIREYKIVIVNVNPNIYVICPCRLVT